jgi:hemoglobin/transferrin/lactoferrin receptor protein
MQKKEKYPLALALSRLVLACLGFVTVTLANAQEAGLQAMQFEKSISNTRADATVNPSMQSKPLKELSDNKVAENALQTGAPENIEEAKPEGADESTSSELPTNQTLDNLISDEQTGSEGVSSDDVLPEVKVNATSIKEKRIDQTQSITTVTTQDLQRTQPSNIFDAIRDVPGVAISGGPRPSGMTFNVRGFTDNEDVTVKVDGVFKGFEKYRFGGTFIEPELLKSIEVQRGPQIASGSGSLGGTILATTKDAADLLAPGQSYGARAKFGYANNNDEYSRSYIAYARPHDKVDLLYSYSNRQSNNIERADGTPLESSAISSVSRLLKIGLFPTDDLVLTTSIVTFDDTGLQPYDTTGGQPGAFGNTIRAIDDKTFSQTIHFTPDDPLVDLKVIVGKGHTNLKDFFPPGLSPTTNPVQAGCSGIVYTPNPADTRCRGNVTDIYEYEMTNIDIANTAQLFKSNQIQLSLLTGYQYLKSDRKVGRYFENPALNIAVDGFNASQPPGTKTTESAYVQPRLVIGAFSVIPGVRFDQNTVEAKGGTLNLLKNFNQANKIVETQTTYSLGLAYELVPKQLTLFSNYGQGFRPALVDEYFTQGPFSRCLSFFTPSGPRSQICGDLYQPQTSESTEVGVSYQNPRLFDTEAQLTSKLTLFHIHTNHLLNSFGETTSGEIVQRGVEKRNGIEFETSAQYKAVYGRMAYSHISGSIEQDARRNFSGRFNAFEALPLYTAPANALSVTLGARLNQLWDVNLSYRKISSRTIVSGGGGSVPLRFGTQDGYELFNAGIFFSPTRNLGFRLIGENLTNKAYNVDGGFGGSIGTEGPGRNIRFVTELIY